jgi:hypothetical protein
MSVKTRELYRGPNGDRRLLSCESDAQRVFIRHEPNAPSEGRASNIDIGTFLTRGPLNPEHLALLRLIATLITSRRFARECSDQLATLLQKQSRARSVFVMGSFDARLRDAADWQQR